MKPLLVLGLVVSALAGLSASYEISLTPVDLEAKSLNYGAASTQFLIDSERSSLSDLTADTGALAVRAAIVSQFIASEDLRRVVSRRMGLESGQVAVTAEATSFQQGGRAGGASAVPTLPTDGSYSISFQPQAELPIVDVYARAPTALQAERLADATVASLTTYVDDLAERDGIRKRNPLRLVVRQTGEAIGGQVTTPADKLRSVLVAAGVFVAWCVFLVLASGFVVRWREARASPPSQQESTTSD